MSLRSGLPAWDLVASGLGREGVPGGVSWRGEALTGVEGAVVAQDCRWLANACFVRNLALHLGQGISVGLIGHLLYQHV